MTELPPNAQNMVDNMLTQICEINDNAVRTITGKEPDRQSEIWDSSFCYLLASYMNAKRP